MISSIQNKKRPRFQNTLIFENHPTGKKIFRVITLYNPSKTNNTKLEVTNLPPGFTLQQLDWDVPASGSIDLEIGWKPENITSCNYNLQLVWRMGKKIKREIIQLIGESAQLENSLSQSKTDEIQIYKDDDEIHPLKRRRIEANISITGLSDKIPLQAIEPNIEKPQKSLNDYIKEVTEERKLKNIKSNVVQDDWKVKVLKDQRHRWIQSIQFDTKRVKDEISRLETIFLVKVDEKIIQNIEKSYPNSSIPILFHWYATVLLFFKINVSTLPLTKQQFNLSHELLVDFYEFSKTYQLKQKTRDILNQIQTSIPLLEEKWSVTSLATLCNNLLTDHFQRIFQKSIVFIQTILQARKEQNCFSIKMQSLHLIQNHFRSSISISELNNSLNNIKLVQSRIKFLIKLEQLTLHSKSCIKIQNVARSFMLRKKFSKIKKGITTLQRIWRAKYEKNRLKKNRNSIIFIQSILRTKVILKNQIESQYIIPIQNIIRASIARLSHSIQSYNIKIVQNYLRMLPIKIKYESSEELMQLQLHQRFIRDLRLIRNKAKQQFKKELECVTNFEKSIQKEKDRQESILQSRIKSYLMKKEGKERSQGFEEASIESEVRKRRRTHEEDHIQMNKTNLLNMMDE